jgi:hypothetical protein
MHFDHTVYLCVAYDSDNKRKLFTHTAFTNWLGRHIMFSVRNLILVFEWSSTVCQDYSVTGFEIVAGNAKWQMLLAKHTSTNQTQTRAQFC